FVDLGYGAEPFTTLESAARLRRLNPTLPVLGVEIDATRVAAALPYADSLTHFRLGGFNLPLQAGERVRLVRAFNVLRQYEESAVADAYAMLAQQVVPGGLLIEGTSDPFGRLWVAHVMRRQPAAPSWLHEATVFSTNFRTGFDPSEFQAILPKDLIHRMVPGEPIYDFFQAWKRATLESIGAKTWGVRQWFATSAQGLAARGYRVDLRHRWLKRGYLLWLRPTALFGARDA
ncbi:MAG: hypothetical protein KDE58_03530, partial [Caldilineaceae bacterium]|nr:hypothetical protein [Caldilineaceae bacterium]